MQSTTYLINHLKNNYPSINFIEADDFKWSAKKQTVYFNFTLPHAEIFCLHEVSHALLGHETYTRDIDLLKMERDAWDYARQKLATKYKVKINEDIVQDNLDTYRDWLHARSSCPNCKATGIQTKILSYRCIACRQTWRVNEARICSLKRYSNQKSASV